MEVQWHREGSVWYCELECWLLMVAPSGTRWAWAVCAWDGSNTGDCVDSGTANTRNEALYKCFISVPEI